MCRCAMNTHTHTQIIPFDHVQNKYMKLKVEILLKIHISVAYIQSWTHAYTFTAIL